MTINISFQEKQNEQKYEGPSEKDFHFFNHKLSVWDRAQGSGLKTRGTGLSLGARESGLGLGHLIPSSLIFLVKETIKVLYKEEVSNVVHLVRYHVLLDHARLFYFPFFISNDSGLNVQNLII